MLALAAVAVLAGCESGPRSVVGGGRDIRQDDVAGRPWPERVTPSGQWPASIEGTGLRLTLTTGGTIVGALGRTTVDMGSADPERLTGGKALAFPGGERWFPQKPFRLEAEGDLPFRPATAGGSHDTDGAFSLEATGRAVAVRVGLEDLLTAAGGQVAVSGEFVAYDGARVDHLVVPAGTTVVAACPEPFPEPPDSIAPPMPTIPCGPGNEEPSEVSGVTVDAAAGMTVQASGDGEAAVAGDARAAALDRSWTGLVVALEGRQVNGSAAYDGGQWSLTAGTADALQLWVDVWPVADTVLEARSFSTGPGFFDRSPLLRVAWVNVGHATSQILEAEGVGTGASGVGFDLNKTLGHDAGLGVRRGDRVLNFDGGADVDSNLVPGGETDRELSYRRADPAALVLRGNFPEVQLELAVPGV